jgi:tetratricopeptide (TPR) repeat protein
MKKTHPPLLRQRLLQRPTSPNSWLKKVSLCATTFALSIAVQQHAQAQAVEVLEWQPGAAVMVPQIQTTPHSEVRRFLRQAKYAQALLIVNKSLATNPRDPQMRFWQGYIFEQMGQPDMALQIYLELSQEYPEIPEPSNNLGVLYAAKGDYAKAKAALDAALRANPNYAVAHENMGDVLANMAYQSYERALQLNSSQRAPAKKMERLKPALELTQDKPLPSKP